MKNQPKPLGMSIDEWLYTDDKPKKPSVPPKVPKKTRPSHIAKNKSWTPVNDNKWNTSKHIDKQKSSGVNEALSVIRGGRGFGAFLENSDDDENKETKSNNNNGVKNEMNQFKRQPVYKVKKVKPYTGDPTIWNTYLDEHNNVEPTNEWKLHKWVKANSNLPTISFKEAREMYKGCKGRGRL